MTRQFFLLQISAQVSGTDWTLLAWSHAEGLPAPYWNQRRSVSKLRGRVGAWIERTAPPNLGQGKTTYFQGAIFYALLQLLLLTLRYFHHGLHRRPFLATIAHLLAPPAVGLRQHHAPTNSKLVKQSVLIQTNPHNTTGSVCSSNHSVLCFHWQYSPPPAVNSPSDYRFKNIRSIPSTTCWSRRVN